MKQTDTEIQNNTVGIQNKYSYSEPEKALFAVSDWKIDTINNFTKYLSEYSNLIDYKK
ncbi:MAG: hypothetical protein US60_C0039G0013 [Microgenomates group bacterium GW2011_GWC1_37_8]|nr:MAG: hypothetical protein US60_C0039G0013 [Microgenomates group bacterium GW2011_GWC1_37_8]